MLGSVGNGLVTRSGGASKYIPSGTIEATPKTTANYRSRLHGDAAVFSPALIGGMRERAVHRHRRNRLKQTITRIGVQGDWDGPVTDIDRNPPQR